MQARYETTRQRRGLSPSVAHELKNPLQVINDLLYLLEREPHLTEDGRHCLRLAHDEIHRLGALVRGTLDRYHDTAQRESTSIPMLLDDIIQLYKSRFEARHISVDTRYCGHGSLSVFPQQLRGAFSNLLLNAADALPAGGTIRLRVRRARQWSGESRRGLRVTFADNGTGITPDNLARVSQPFFSTKGTGGSGMGLSIVKEAVTQHGGALRVRSTTRAGRSGSVFAVFLPIV